MRPLVGGAEGLDTIVEGDGQLKSANKYHLCFLLKEKPLTHESLVMS